MTNERYRCNNNNISGFPNKKICKKNINTHWCNSLHTSYIDGGGIYITNIKGGIFLGEISSKCGIFITHNENIFRVKDINNYREYSLVEQFKIKNEDDMGCVKKTCGKVNARLEELRKSGMEYDITIDKEIKDLINVFRYNLDTTKKINIKG